MWRTIEDVILIADCAHYREGRRQHGGPIEIERAAEVCRQEDERGFVWIGLVEPDPDELTDAELRFGLK